ncbi:MAG: response regulator [Candidatus Moranbacteria bacterium]|nr:response regulator [Candidatus Moranbacteria bacterium]
MADQKKKILIVEDERPIAGALEMKLNSSGFETIAASNGEDALKALDDGSFDLILLDLVMPRMNGFDFLKKKKELNKETPVIILSNLSQQEDMEKAMELGVSDYFVKSNMAISDIVEHIKKILDQK